MESYLQKSLDLVDELLETYDKNDLLLELKIFGNLEEDNEYITKTIISNLENIDIIQKEDLLKHYHHLNLLLKFNKFDIYNNILKDVNIEILETLMINALLRLSYLFRRELSEWYVFLNKSITELNNRKLNTNQILIGLI